MKDKDYRDDAKGGSNMSEKNSNEVSFPDFSAEKDFWKHHPFDPQRCFEWGNYEKYCDKGVLEIVGNLNSLPFFYTIFSCSSLYEDHEGKPPAEHCGHVYFRYDDENRNSRKFLENIPKIPDLKFIDDDLYKVFRVYLNVDGSLSEKEHDSLLKERWNLFSDYVKSCL